MNKTKLLSIFIVISLFSLKAASAMFINVELKEFTVNVTTFNGEFNIISNLSAKNLFSVVNPQLKGIDQVWVLRSNQNINNYFIVTDKYTKTHHTICIFTLTIRRNNNINLTLRYTNTTIPLKFNIQFPTITYDSVIEFKTQNPDYTLSINFEDAENVIPLINGKTTSNVKISSQKSEDFDF